MYRENTGKWIEFLAFKWCCKLLRRSIILLRRITNDSQCLDTIVMPWHIISAIELVHFWRLEIRDLKKGRIDFITKSKKLSARQDQNDVLRTILGESYWYCTWVDVLDHCSLRETNHICCTTRKYFYHLILLWVLKWPCKTISKKKYMFYPVFFTHFEIFYW